jgi:hypothetical protein
MRRWGWVVAAACGALVCVADVTAASEHISWPHVTSEVPRDEKIEARIAELLKQLSLEQKVAQMIQPDIRHVTPEIVVFGENPYAEWFGDVKSLEYQAGTKSDLALLRRLRAAGIPVVSIFLTGRPLVINEELESSDAFVVAWLPGSEGGGLADVLFRKPNGRVNHSFTGKLSFSWPRDVSQTAINRHDANDEPLFPYGFGLTY